MLATGYTLTSTTPTPFAETVERVRSELGREGFGVLCEIDVRATLQAKLGVESEPHLILGACNPPLAHQALAAEPDLGVLPGKRGPDRDRASGGYPCPLPIGRED